MTAIKLGLIVSLLSLNGCCLSVVSGDSEDATGGMTSGGGATSGGQSSSGGGSSTGANPCSHVYCAPAFVCDPGKGVCECAGRQCTGNCDPSSGACLAACVSGGGPYPIIGQSPYAVELPPAILGQAYTAILQAGCGASSAFWTLLSPPSSLTDVGLSFYPGQGTIEGVPTMASGSVPFEFEFEAADQAGNAGVQNYLLQVTGGQ